MTSNSQFYGMQVLHLTLIPYCTNLCYVLTDHMLKSMLDLKKDLKFAIFVAFFKA